MTTRLHSYTFRRAVRITFSILITLCCICLLVYLIGRTFVLRNIIVDAPGMSITLDDGQLGQNLFFLPTEKLRTELLGNYPLLASVRFEKKYPQTLILHLQKKTATAALVSDGSYFAIDDHGVVIDILSGPAGYTLIDIRLPVVNIGTVIRDPRMVASLTILNALRSTVPLQRIYERDSASLVAISGNTNIIFPQSGDLQAKADTLQIITEGFRMKGTLPTVIDLRFEKPIITN